MLKLSVKVFVAILVVILSSSPSFAQNKDTSYLADEGEKVDSLLKEMESTERTPDSLVAAPITMSPSPRQRKLMDDSTLAMYRDAMSAYYQYRISGFSHRKEVFAWQLFSTKLIFWAVLLMVFCGIAFSGIQFYKSIREDVSESGEAPESSVTEFKASPTGIKVTSPVLGVIILTISLAFFYLYLVYVYPIKEIF